MTKAWQIFAVGGICIILVFTAVANLTVAYGIAAAILFAGFALGFFFQPPSDFLSLFLPSLQQGSPQIQINGQSIGERYPQFISFKLELVNLHNLIVAALMPVAVLIWVISGNDVPVGFGFPPSNVAVLPIYLFWLPLSLIRKWIKERRLLNRSFVTWGLIEGSGKTTRYQFFDNAGDRYGGMVSGRFDHPTAGDNVCVVVADRKDLENSIPSFAFHFHSFKLIDKTHASEKIT